jgi:predicted nuclease of predicted toxin-antitoxin system
MLRLVSDENFRGPIFDGLRNRCSELDVVRVQDVGLMHTSDQDILAWAAAEGRIVLSHDRKTLAGFAIERVQAGQPMPGVFIVDDRMPIGKAIEDILLAAECLTPDECNNLVKFIPLTS